MLKPAARLSLVLVCAPAACSADGTAASTSDDGARSFNAHCVACHQADARGIPGVYPSLVGSPVLLGDSTALTRWVVKGERPASLAAGRYPTVMQKFGWMKAPEAAGLFTYLRSHFGNAAPAVTQQLVQAALE